MNIPRDQIIRAFADWPDLAKVIVYQAQSLRDEVRKSYDAEMIANLEVLQRKMTLFLVFTDKYSWLSSLSSDDVYTAIMTVQRLFEAADVLGMETNSPAPAEDHYIVTEFTRESIQRYLPLI